MITVLRSIFISVFVAMCLYTVASAQYPGDTCGYEQTMAGTLLWVCRNAQGEETGACVVTNGALTGCYGSLIDNQEPTEVPTVASGWVTVAPTKTPGPSSTPTPRPRICYATVTGTPPTPTITKTYSSIVQTVTESARIKQLTRTVTPRPTEEPGTVPTRTLYPTFTPAPSLAIISQYVVGDAAKAYSQVRALNTTSTHTFNTVTYGEDITLRMVPTINRMWPGNGGTADIYFSGVVYEFYGAGVSMSVTGANGLMCDGGSVSGPDGNGDYALSIGLPANYSQRIPRSFGVTCTAIWYTAPDRMGVNFSHGGGFSNTADFYLEIGVFSGDKYGDETPAPSPTPKYSPTPTCTVLDYVPPPEDVPVIETISKYCWVIIQPNNTRLPDGYYYQPGLQVCFELKRLNLDIFGINVADTVALLVAGTIYGFFIRFLTR